MKESTIGQNTGCSCFEGFDYTLEKQCIHRNKIRKKNPSFFLDDTTSPILWMQWVDTRWTDLGKPRKDINFALVWS